MIERVLEWVIPGLLALWLFYHLHFEWSINEQYNYGWAVPFLAAFLFYLRWSTAPERQREPRVPLAVAQWAILLLLLPIRVVEEANPDWRLLSWVLGLAVVGYWLLALARAGGGVWARHFGFPVAFPLVSVPWLVQVENVIVQGLTRAVAYVAVEISGWAGIGAYQLGNVIQLHNGFVGVDEACSGVKTLQAAIMMALFLGELLRLPVGRRIVLVIAGAGWVFACNVGRATTLVVLAASRGLDAMKQWHDSIGIAVLVAGMLGLLALAWLLQRQETMSDFSASNREARRSDWGAQAGSTSQTAAALAWLGVTFVVAEIWYRAHEQRLVMRPEWHASWPVAKTTVREMPIPEETRAILRYNAATSAAWEQPPGVVWWAFFARWEPQQTALQLVRSHSPEICLPAAGRTFVRELPAATVATPAMPLRFRVYEFKQAGRPLFVYVCIQEDKAAPNEDVAVSGEWNLSGRLQAVLAGRRNLGQRLLEVAVIGLGSVEQANEAIARVVPEIVASGAPTG